MNPISAQHQREGSRVFSGEDAASNPATESRSDFFSEIAPAMLVVEEILQSELQSQSWFVDELLTYVASLSGKRMRPALVLLAGQASGELTEHHTTLAAVVEMIHIATLVHDDILDGADTRRHCQTVNQKWGNQSSVLLGDYLFTHAFYLASTLPTTYGCRVIGKATNRVCAGELQQVGNRGNLELTEQEYLEIIGGKTAELCACSTHLGAHYAGAGKGVVEDLLAFGHELGMAFQIADDLLDLTGSEVVTGKSLGSDLENQKMTLPLIHLRDHAGGDRSKVLHRLGEPMSDAARVEISTWMAKHESIAYAKSKAVMFSRSAMQRLDVLQNSGARDTLIAMCEYVIARTR